MSEKLTDEQLNDQNLAHLPGEGPSPVNTRVEATPRESTMYAEIAAGAAPFDPTPAPRFQPVNNDWEVRAPAPTGNPTIVETFQQGIPMDLPDGSGSGVRITPIAVGSDTTGR